MAVAAAETIPESMSEAMFRSNLEDIKSRFAVLLQSIQSALEANNVTKEAVRGVLVGMYPNCEDCVPKTNMEEIFAAATRYKIWDYEHHSPVEKLIRRLLGSQSDYLCDVREYKAHLSGFFATVKLIDYIKYTKVDPTVETSGKIDLAEFTIAHFQKLKVKLNLKRRIDRLSLNYIQDLWEEFVEEFDIPFLTAVVHKVMSGSLEIIWLISPDVAEKIASSASEAVQFYQEHHIVYLAIDDSPVYDELKVVSCDYSAFRIDLCTVSLGTLATARLP